MIKEDGCIGNSTWAEGFGKESKQEEIREGFAKWLRDGVAKIYEVSKDPYVVPEWDDMPDAQKESYRGAALTGLMYLRSKGVVMKVDRKTPKVSDEHSYYELCAQADMLDAGFVAVEDLI